MATSGSVSVTATQYDTLKFSWWINSGDQSTEDNKTLVRWKMELIAGTYGLISSTAAKDWAVTVNGTKYSGTNTIGIGNNATKTLASGTTSVAHNADGTKVFSFSFSQEFAITFSDKYIGTKSGSGSGTLPTIPRASQPSCITWPEHTQNVGEFGDTISIHMNRNSSRFTHTVRYKFGSQSGTIATNVGTGTTWTIPLQLMTLIPNSVKGSGTIYVDTYNGSTLIGTKSCGFTATVPDDITPTCYVQVLDATTTKDTYGNLVKGLSKLQIKVTGTTSYSSPFQSSTVSVLSTSTSGKKSEQVYTDFDVTTGTLPLAGTVKVEAMLVDRRGRQGGASASFPVIDYEKPKVTHLAVHRINESGARDDRGGFVEVVFSAEVTPLNNKNSATYTLRYKKTTDNSYTKEELTSVTGEYNVAFQTCVFAAETTTSYDVEIIAKDDLNTTTRTTSVSTAFSLANWHPSGTGWAFGKVSEFDNTLENALDLNQLGNRYTLSTPGESSKAGYILMASLSVKAAYADTPITFVFSRRLALAPMRVSVTLASENSTTPGVKSVTYEGENFGAFLVHENGSSTYDLYVQKGTEYDTVCLQDWYTSAACASRFTITFPGTLVTTVPGTYYRATPLKAQSLLDFIYPVGSIYLSYSHVSPATLFGGTWVRMENAFLWAVGADGTIGQTGGEKTHTLTVNELPAHSHGSVYSQHASGTKDKAWYTTAGTSVAYGAVSTGGGAAHNNMPPYIQVSAWRRTE